MQDLNFEFTPTARLLVRVNVNRALCKTVI